MEYVEAVSNELGGWVVRGLGGGGGCGWEGGTGQ